ncbi:MAG: outer membrane beta-barrel protein [Oligoflexia bacterium]|nr:outer membrane beta-barrel protein [Oligoflexia bacterium]
MEATVRRLIVTFAFLIAITLMSLSTARAEEGLHTFGLQGGHVGLTDANLGTYGNNLGYGVFFDYAASDYLEIELSGLTSKHTNNSLSLAKTAISISALYMIDQIDIIIPYLKGGAEFDNHTQDALNPVTATSFSTTGFGLNVGAGAKFMASDSFSVGLDLTYHSMFETKIALANGTEAKGIQSYFTALLRLGLVFGDGGKRPGKTF